MKKILLACMLIVIGMPVLAQWTYPTSSIISTTNSVGIGTSNPLGKLHIVGITQTNSFSTSALTLEQPYVDLGSSNFLSASTLYKTNNGSVSWILGALAGTVGTPGNVYGYPGGLAFYTKAADGSSTSSPLERMRIDFNGNVGVGITIPVAKLHVNGNIVTGAGPANLDPASSNGNISYIGSQSGLMLTGWNRSGGEGESDFIANRGNATLAGSGGFAFYDYSNASPGVQTELMRVRSTGQVLIGVSNFATSPQYSTGVNMLAVAGGIETDAITVKLQSAPWPDYVFEPKYTLRPLSEVKTYIDHNHHLPEMPSQADIAKNGQNLGEMNKLLVKKVEELTLYLIEKEKQITNQDEKSRQQEERIKKLETSVSMLVNKSSNAKN